MDIKGRDEIALLVKFWNQTGKNVIEILCESWLCMKSLFDPFLQRAEISWQNVCSTAVVDLLGHCKETRKQQLNFQHCSVSCHCNIKIGNLIWFCAETTSDSRKIFRLGKSLNEYTKLKDILANSKDADPLLKLFNFASRFAFLVYWLYDNLTILSKIKFIKGDTAKNQKKSALFWSIGLLFGVLLELYKLQKSVEQENLAIKAASSANGNVASPPHEIMKKIKADRNLIYINLAKNLGDLIPATNGIELPHRLLGHGFNEGLIAFGGFLSAALTCFQLYPAK